MSGLEQIITASLLWLVLVLPYVRRVSGLNRLDPQRRYLFTCNHVSLLDSVLLGTVFYFARIWPMLVLADRKVWSDSWLRRAASRPFAYMLERGKFNPRRIRELRLYARKAADYQLVVFPEGTRGNGVEVASCQPGVYYVAQEARVPIVPVFFANMQLLSSKTGHFHPLRGFRKVEIYVGDPISPEIYLPLAREDFREFVRRKIIETRPGPPTEHSSS
jgi:1-acyl-sn-glycerol-3-phosphate acyltransferase